MKRRKVVEGEDEVDIAEMEPVLAGKKSEPTHTQYFTLVKESIQAPMRTLCSHYVHAKLQKYPADMLPCHCPHLTGHWTQSDSVCNFDQNCTVAYVPAALKVGITMGCLESVEWTK